MRPLHTENLAANHVSLGSPRRAQCCAQYMESALVRIVSGFPKPQILITVNTEQNRYFDRKMNTIAVVHRKDYQFDRWNLLYNLIRRKPFCIVTNHLRIPCRKKQIHSRSRWSVQCDGTLDFRKVNFGFFGHEDVPSAREDNYRRFTVIEIKLALIAKVSKTWKPKWASELNARALLSY